MDQIRLLMFFENVRIVKKTFAPFKNLETIRQRYSLDSQNFYESLELKDLLLMNN